MGRGADEALSDLEEDAPPVLSTSPTEVSNSDSSQAVRAELEVERQARKAAEAAKAELQSAFTRLKIFTQEAVRQRDEAVRYKEEAQQMSSELGKQLYEALLSRDDAIRQRDGFAQARDDAVISQEQFCRQVEDASKARESSMSEIEVAARLLVAGAENITARASSVKRFQVNLPQSSSYTGVAAIAYGYTKRAEEIVDELVKHQETALKNRSDMREQMEQRNYQTAIEISELEASIQRLKDGLSQKSLELEKWQKLAEDKEDRISEIEQEMSHKLAEAEKETNAIKTLAQAAEIKIEKLKAPISDLSNLIFKANETLTKLFDSSSNSQTHITNKASSSIRGEPEEGIQECTSRLKEVVDLCLKLRVTWKEHRDLRKKEMDDLEGTITRLITEKKEITNFLKGALANKQGMLEAVSKANLDSNHNLNTATKNWETKNESDLERSRFPSGNAMQNRMEGSLSDEFKTGEAISMASALENELKNLRQEIFELQQFLAVARGEVEWLRVTSERQAKELIEQEAKIHELEEQQSLAQENVEGFKMDLAAADQEILRWKQAATKEAEAGATVLEEVERCQEEIIVLKEKIQQLSQSLEECSSKLHWKEEMATAAITARNAAEQSLRIADEHSLQLRERIEEMTRQFEALQGIEDEGGTMSLFGTCWPYQWLKGKLPELRRNTAVRAGDEIGELLEPFV